MVRRLQVAARHAVYAIAANGQEANVEDAFLTEPLRKYCAEVQNH